MARIKDIAAAIEKLAPLSVQEDYDNAGLIIGDPEDEVKGCLICLDVSEEVISEAHKNDMNLIISHHPVIFGKLSKLTGQSATERIVMKAIKEGIAVYSAHTNLDNIESGVSQILGRKLGLIKMQVLRKSSGLLRKLVTFCPRDHADIVREAIFSAGAGHIGNYDQCSFNAEGMGSFRGDESTNPFTGEPGKLHFENEVRIETVFPAYLEKKIIHALIEAHPYEEVAYDIYKLENEFGKIGMGIIGELTNEMTENDFLQKLKDELKVPCIRHSKLKGKMVRKVAVCGGSGSFLIADAILKGADFYITADIKYHQFQVPEGKMVIADVGHFESEQFTCQFLADYLEKNFTNFAVRISDTPVNPVNYF
jgi:dinuclear metal center YbgI/SA1388 family protein